MIVRDFLRLISPPPANEAEERILVAGLKKLRERVNKIAMDWSREEERSLKNGYDLTLKALEKAVHLLENAPLVHSSVLQAVADERDRILLFRPSIKTAGRPRERGRKACLEAVRAFLVEHGKDAGIGFNELRGTAGPCVCLAKALWDSETEENEVDLSAWAKFAYREHGQNPE